MKKVLSTIGTIVLVIIVVIMVLISGLMIISSSNNGVASVFGYSPIVLKDTKSMEPFLTSNDLVIIKEQDASHLEKGQIISFWGLIGNQKSLITHRIYNVITLDDGTCVYETKGDNNTTYDQDPMNENRQLAITPDDIVGVYQTHIPGLGAVFGFVQTPNGMLFCVVIPLGLLFLWQLYRVIAMALRMHRDSVAEKSAELSETEKQRVIAEYLQKQAAASKAPSEETPAEDTPEA